MIGISRDRHHSPKIGFFYLHSTKPPNDLGGYLSDQWEFDT
jgi:hypothetical protein